jgi:hypothetical protein
VVKGEEEEEDEEEGFQRFRRGKGGKREKRGGAGRRDSHTRRLREEGKGLSRLKDTA